MDWKDFKRIVAEAISKKHKKNLSVYSYKNRQSRPRVKKDILREK